MKINKCGCGGEGLWRIDSMYLYYIECDNLRCTCRDTRWFSSKEEALTAWNKANPSEYKIRKDQTGKILNKLNTTFNEYIEIRDKHTVPEAQDFWEAQANAIGREIDKIKEEFGG